MKSSTLRNDSGFTIIELIAVIIVIGILSSTAVPKFINLTDEANRAKCQAHQGAISSAVALNYAKTVVNDPSQANWIENLTFDDVEADWFAHERVPLCPLGGEYTLSDGNVTCSIPEHNWIP